MPSACRGLCTEGPLLPGVVIKMPAPSFKKVETMWCNGRSSGWVLGHHPYARHMHVTPSCACAEYNSLVTRHLVDNMANYNPRLVRKLHPIVVKEVVPCTYMSVINGYRGQKRAVYMEARDTLLREGLGPHHAKVVAFVKTEKRFEHKSPRMIQHRSPAYCLLLAKYLKPFEEAFYTQTHGGLRFVTKGLNMVQRATLFRKQFLLYDSPCFVLLDHSKFDASVRTEHLKYLHKQYLRAIPSRGLAKLLRHQLVNRGVTPSGITYKVKATRMSGEFDTALGNTMLNFAVIKYCMGKIKFHLMVDGDDSVVTMEKRDLLEFKNRFHLFDKMGFKTKAQYVDNPSDVEYCQCKYVDGPVPYFCRDPIKVISGLTVACKSYQGASDRYLGGIAQGELHLYKGSPVLSPILEKLLVKKPIIDDATHYKLKMDAINIPLEESRLAFYETFGITPVEQLRMESAVYTHASKCPARVLQMVSLLAEETNEH